MSTSFQIPPAGSILANRYRIVKSDVSMRHSYDIEWYIRIEILESNLPDYNLSIPINHRMIEKYGSRPYVEEIVRRCDRFYVANSQSRMSKSSSLASASYRKMSGVHNDEYWWSDESLTLPDMRRAYPVDFLDPKPKVVGRNSIPQKVDDLVHEVLDNSELIDAIF